MTTGRNFVYEPSYIPQSTWSLSHVPVDQITHMKIGDQIDMTMYVDTEIIKAAGMAGVDWYVTGMEFMPDSDEWLTVTVASEPVSHVP